MVKSKCDVSWANENQPETEKEKVEWEQGRNWFPMDNEIIKNQPQNHQNK